MRGAFPWRRKLAVLKTSGLLLVLAVVCVSRAEPVPFRTGVLPILTKAGCNSGACHGAATGQGGFKLSLLGYDAGEDYDRITREFAGRRVDLAEPARSLFLRKPSGQIEHEGGRRLRAGSDGYELLLKWIAAGAPFGPRDLRVANLAVEPSDLLIDDARRVQSLRVKATLSDGSVQDVTKLALYTSNDDSVAAVSGEGAVTVTGRGLTSIMIRYGGQVAAARLAVPVGDPDSVVVDLSSANYIDDHVRLELARLRVPASPPSDDAEFLRRVFLDLSGRLPSAEAARVFLSEPTSPEKRLRTIETLLHGEDFVDFWTMKLADLLLLGGQGEAAVTYYGWLRQQVATNAPLDRMTRALLTASGPVAKVGPAGFMALASDPRDLAEHVGRMFLGTRIACARCHAHPADRWTQDDYHAFAAYFAGIHREDGVVQWASRGVVEHPKTGLAMSPRPLGATGRPASMGGDPRMDLADWLTSPGNDLFARAMANRIWRHLMGRGLVEPVDDLRPTNPASHPALLEALALDLVRSGFDLRHLIRRIVQSGAYQLTSRSSGINRSDRVLYSHAMVKELSAPVFADAVAQVTGVPDVYDGQDEGTRAVQLISPAVPAPALDVLGRCARKRTCETASRTGGGLAQALHLINGSTINGKLQGGFVEALKGRPSHEIVSELYLRAFTRSPLPEERATWETLLDADADRTQAVRDLVWTVLNSREFALNH